MKEVKAYAFAIGNFSIPFVTRDQLKVIEALKKMDGFFGVKPEFPKGTLLIFKSENHAKRAMNELEAMGVKTGGVVGECFIPEEYAKEIKDKQ